jgi:nitroreductase
MEKPAPSERPIHPLIAQRWSPRSFSDQPVAPETLGALFEAARWSASCFNDQPWNFLVATQADPGYQKLFECLVPANQGWAKQAPVLGAAIAQTTFKHNGKPNDWALYDLGQAMATLAIQATSMGLFIHQMAGFDSEKLMQAFHLDPIFKPMALFVVGYPGDPERLSADLQVSERGSRSRYPLTQFVFSEAWGQPAGFLFL